MDYKVGDEVLVKAKIIAGVRRYFGVEIEGNRFDVCETNIITAPDMTAEEAWEIAKKLFADYSNIELDEIFGKGWSFPKLMELTPQEAKAKIEAWEAEKEIKVGDFVEFEDEIFCVTSLVGEYCCGIDVNGYVYSANKKDTKKTGRSIDIERLLKQVGGNE